MMIRAAEEDTAPAFLVAEVVDHEYCGHGIAVLTVAPDKTLPYQAGQHVTVQTARWPRVWRPYSVACRPRDDGLLSFHVKAVPGGGVSTALVHHTPPGTVTRPSRRRSAAWSARSGRPRKRRRKKRRNAGSGTHERGSVWHVCGTNGLSGACRDRRPEAANRR